MKDSRLCNKCGLIPQTGATPKTPCKPKCKKCKKDCCTNDFVFRKVVIPAALGDDETGNDKPSNGAYTNSLVQYEANGALYLYDSDGIYTKLGEGGGEYPVESVNGKTGVVVLTTEDIENLSGYQNGEQVSLAVSTAVNAEATAREAADAELTQGIATVANGLATEVTTRQDADAAINSKIPAQASATNPLADRSFVNSSVQTATANFRGNWDTYAQIPTDATLYPADYAGSTTPTTNDYLVVQDASDTPVEAGEDPLTGTWRFKYSGEWATDGKSGWHPEYQVNETPLTSDQLAALNSGITATAVTQIGTNASDIADLQTDVAGKQDTLTAGQNITIDPNTNTISATDTTYSNFTGTDGATAGTAGLVPAPATTDAGKFLKADGTWDNAGGGTLYTTTGANTDGAMTQKAATEMVYATDNTANPVAATNRICIGSGAVSRSNNIISIGKNAGTSNTSTSYATFVGSRSSLSTYNANYSVILGDISLMYGGSANSVGIGYTGRVCANAVTIGYNANTGPSSGTGLRYFDIAIGSGAYANSNTSNSSFQATSSIAIGAGAKAGSGTAEAGVISIGGNAGVNSGPYNVLIGGGADANNTSVSYSVALGYSSKTTRNSEVSVGGGSGSYTSTRYIANVRDPALPQDAATKNYVDSLLAITQENPFVANSDFEFVDVAISKQGNHYFGSATLHKTTGNFTGSDETAASLSVVPVTNYNLNGFASTGQWASSFIPCHVFISSNGSNSGLTVKANATTDYIRLQIDFVAGS